MTIEEANKLITINIRYDGEGWMWMINTHKPYGNILGYRSYDTPDKALEELKGFLRYFSENTLKNGDTIRAFINKHNPKNKEHDED